MLFINAIKEKLLARAGDLSKELANIQLSLKGLNAIVENNDTETAESIVEMFIKAKPDFCYNALHKLRQYQHQAGVKVESTLKSLEEGK